MRLNASKLSGEANDKKDQRKNVVLLPALRESTFPAVRADTKVQNMPFRCKACKHDIEVNIA